MSPVLKRPCPRCRRVLIASPAQRCRVCARLHNARRGSATARGYDARWARLAKLVIARDRLCVLCLAQGRVTPSTEADHVLEKRRGGNDDLNNLRGTCKSCNAGRR